MLKAVRQFKLYYQGQARVTLGILVAMPSLLSIVIESHVKDIEILSIKYQVRSDIGDEG